MLLYSEYSEKCIGINMFLFFTNIIAEENVFLPGVQIT